MGLPIWLSRKESTCNAGDVGSTPLSGRSPGEGNVNPLQYSCLRNPTVRGAWRATVHGVSKESIGHNLATKQYNFHMISVLMVNQKLPNEYMERKWWIGLHWKDIFYDNKKESCKWKKIFIITNNGIIPRTHTHIYVCVHIYTYLHISAFNTIISFFVGQYLFPKQKWKSHMNFKHKTFHRWVLNK